LAAGVPQKEIARRLGVCPSAVSQWFRPVKRNRAQQRAWLAKKRAWCQRHPERVRAYNRAAWRRRWSDPQFRERHRQKMREYMARRAARKRRRAAKKIDYEAVYARDRGRCYLCGAPVSRAVAHFDHVTPLAKGGAHVATNLRPVHPACNRRKNSKRVTLF
jgi:5-methylcytosine-specific restriction endonuclease McrA